jgi:tRNA pseudouridine13 synthase
VLPVSPWFGSSEMTITDPLRELPRAGGMPPVAGVLRAAPEDFRVDEDLGFAPDGEGEHVLLQVSKRNVNTDRVAQRIAQLAGVRPVDVGYAGLKDRNAVASQWLSVHLAGRKEPHWQALEDGELRVLAVARHRRKLRRGALHGNRFDIVVRALVGAPHDLEPRLARIAAECMPNYFGEQRFGRGGANLERASALFEGRLRERNPHKRGLYLSAARAQLFNLVLARRVQEGTWNHALPGDAMMLAGSRSYFVADAPDAEIERRVAAFDLHPSGPLWGRGEPPSRGQARLLEDEVLSGWEGWRAGLERFGLEQERRALRLVVRELAWELNGGALRLRFHLPAGTYATTVLRELVGNVEAERGD